MARITLQSCKVVHDSNCRNRFLPMMLRVVFMFGRTPKETSEGRANNILLALQQRLDIFILQNHMGGMSRALDNYPHLLL